jgi:hypothetical protein
MMKANLKQARIGSTTSAVTRADFLRLLGRGAIGAGAGLAGISTLLNSVAPAMAADAVVEVFPTGLPSDVDEVRAAVNGGVGVGPSPRNYGAGGGVVRLKATNIHGVPTFFNFGDGDLLPIGGATIDVKRDVVILGEAMSGIPDGLPIDSYRDTAYKPDRTVIYGGKRAFTCLRTTDPAIRLKVRNLYFAHPKLAAVQVHKSAGLEVTDCVIYDTQTPSDQPPAQEPRERRVAVGIEATGLGLGQPDPGLSGAFRVVNNRIYRMPPPKSQDARDFRADTGIIMQLASMSGHISGNDVVGFAFQGIGIDRNIGPVVIKANQVSWCGYGSISGSGALISGGIGVRGTSAPVFIERNDVLCGAHGKQSTENERWSNNGIMIGSSNVVVTSNTVAGAVAYDGIRLITYTQADGVTFTEGSCRFHSNNLVNLVARRSQVFIGTQCPGNQFTNNDYGADLEGGGVGIPATVPPVTPLAGIVVDGNNNQLVNELFWGDYGVAANGSGLPCIWLRTLSSGNRVTALKQGNPPYGADVCLQVRDEGSNDVPGLERCVRR